MDPPLILRLELGLASVVLYRWSSEQRTSPHSLSRWPDQFCPSILVTMWRIDELFWSSLSSPSCQTLPPCCYDCCRAAAAAAAVGLHCVITAATLHRLTRAAPARTDFSWQGRAGIHGPAAQVLMRVCVNYGNDSEPTTTSKDKHSVWLMSKKQRGNHI